jgi:hypothetical protein
MTTAQMARLLALAEKAFGAAREKLVMRGQYFTNISQCGIEEARQRLRCRNAQGYFSMWFRDPTLIDSILLGSVLVHSAALLSTHASVSNKARHRHYYDTV